MSSKDATSRREFISRAAALGAGIALPSIAVAAPPQATTAAPVAPRTDAVAVADSAGRAAGTTQAGRTYATINQLSWNEILADRGPELVPPLTVHLPIQPVHSPDLVHVDCALNASRRIVVPGLSTKNVQACQAAQEMETFIVQFAIDDPPFVPDYRRSKLALADNRYPLAHADYFLADMLYQFEYHCTAIDAEQNVLWVVVSASNEGELAQHAHVRAKVNFQRECDVHFYHYTPFFWDNTKWQPCKGVRLEERRLWRDSRLLGKVLPGPWTFRWEAEATYADQEFDRRFPNASPHHVQPHLRLHQMQDVVHFSIKLEPGERKTFALALLVNFEKAGPQHHEALAHMEPEPSRHQAEAQFRRQFTAANTRLACPVEHWDDIFTQLQLSTLQMLIKWPGRPGLMPTQGGSSERHFVWVWEAVAMLRPMLRLGHFAAVRQALDQIFSLQDAGCPPEGELTTTAGAIGTTGPKWLNSTGSALILASEYYQYSHDHDFLEKYLPKILLAMQWIVGEIRATRKLAADGTRPPWYGLMPFGCATDGDIGYFVAITDAFTQRGLELAVSVLELIKHPRAAEMRRELEQYRADLDRAIVAMTRLDGYIERKLDAGRKANIFNGFERVCGAVQLAYTGCIDVNSERFHRFMTYVEQNLMDGFFAGRMDRDVMYLCVAEAFWHHAYLQLGQWKKAFAALRCSLRFGMTQDTFQVQERFSRQEPAFTPWQPNGSGNGRILEMMLDSLLFEHNGVTTLLAGMPWLWLRRNGTTRLEGLYTPRGRLNLEMTMVDSQHGRLVLSADAPGVLPDKLRLPEHFEICQAEPAPVCQMKQELEIAGPIQKITLLLREVVLEGRRLGTLSTPAPMTILGGK